jgi:glycosyltransferase involved in cell wall biosynthesis
LSQADFFVLSSDNEGMPNVILEAMAASLPVITTPAGDAGVVVRDGMTGYVIPFDDVDRLASRMIDLTTSQGLRGMLGETGRRHAEQNYSCELLGDRLLNIYAEIESRLRAHRI